MQRRPVASSARRNRRAARLPDASASGHNTTGPHPLARPPIVIDNYHYASNHTAKPGRARPTPRPGGAAGRRHADHPEAHRRLYQRQHPTGLRRRAAALGRMARGRPRLTTPRWPSTSARSRIGLFSWPSCVSRPPDNGAHGDTLSRRGGQRHARPAIRDTSPPDSATGPSDRRWRRR